jgi:hypothetical protein
MYRGHTHAVILALLSGPLCAAAFGQAPVAGLRGGRCTAAVPAEAGELHPRVGPVRPLIAGSFLTDGAEVRLAPDARAAFHLHPGPEPSQPDASVYAGPGTTLSVCPNSDPRRLLQMGAGMMVVVYGGEDGVPLIVSTPQAWVRLSTGTLIAEAGPAGATFTLVRGSARRFDGTLPAAEATEISGGEALTPEPGAQSRVDAMANDLLKAATRLAAAGWIEKAETGDLVPVAPPGTAARVPVIVGLGNVEVVEPITQTVTVTPVSTSVIATTGATSQTEALLSSGNPASVLVGRRLERTRIVGNPGTVGTSVGVRFNPEARLRPFLGPDR